VTDCLFCGIVAGTVPAQIVLDDDVAVAFLDARPVFKGHVLVVPRQHYETLPDLPPDLVGPLFTRVRRLSAAVLNNTVSQSVPHLHVHVVPRTRGDGLRGFFWPRGKYAADDEAADYARRLREAIAATDVTDAT
jgi:histidine triad (HIT) family protein